ncbi:uncharacterized protein A1O9_02179 [Exophiala aquamarina CBS 119918]|uniref:Carboxylic ester hydrolase n=1 Tax=Exophiala aquamarina CBS 119918 TaxID=1182545 RepID=A0A072PMP2_9EURO|nr:uncharacterized protein A1O9_02179 [Exophiala aquamarina CBS 119918]KEF60618.1 hypothetical protein A1O9_02179 [Exophiala aquamarina CBS 119918]
MQNTLPHGDFDISDLDGLHLNITVPSGAKGLPVLVFIHGGGFTVGSNAWPQYDQSRLVKLSIDLGMPFIGVSVNYRIGAPGFLTSKELQAAGCKCNNGIRDQRTALLWIKQQIGGFGGDPGKVTLMGQSAGSVACMIHLQSKEALFQQLILMSGSTLLLPPLPPPVSEIAYSLSMKALDLEGLTVDERVAKLIHGPKSDLYEKITPAIPLLPVIDNEVVHPGPSYEELFGGATRVENVLPGTKWCQRILVGDCEFDASIYRGMLEPHKNEIAKRFHNFASRTLCGFPSVVEELERVYNITTETADDAALDNILEWTTDIGFYLPAITIAHTWPGKSYLYHLNEVNPWEGPKRGKAAHIMDVILLFQNFQESLSQDQQAQGKRFAENTICFIAGSDPFPSCQAESNGAMVYGPPASPAGFIKSSEPSDFGRRAVIHKLSGEVGYDTLQRMLGNILAGQW